MQIIKLTVIIAFIFNITYINGYSEATSVYDCYTCISTYGDIMCRDLKQFKYAYCCDSTEKSGACTRTDFCSSQVQTLSMQMFTCPFVTKQCGTTPYLTLSNNSTKAISLSYKSNRYFNSTAICYYAITADSTAFNLSSQKYYINISVSYSNNTYIHINNGTSVKKASDALQVNEYSTGLEFGYQAYNNTVYIFIVSFDTYPAATIKYWLYTVPETVINNSTNSTSNNTSNNITDGNTTTTTVYLSRNKEKPKPQYGIYSIIALVSIGVILYIVVSLITKTPEKKRGVEFDGVEKKTNREDFTSNRKLITVVDEDNNEQPGMTEQDLVAKEKSGLHSFYHSPAPNQLSLQDNTFLDRSQMGHDHNDKSQLGFFNSEKSFMSNQQQSKSQRAQFSKVHPLDMSNTTSTIIPHQNTKEEKKSFWNRFKGNKNEIKPKKKDGIRKFSIINPNRNISILPSSQQTFEVNASDQITGLNANNSAYTRNNINLSLSTMQPSIGTIQSNNNVANSNNPYGSFL